MFIGRAALLCIAAAKERRVDLRNDTLALGHVEAIEWPEVDGRFCFEHHAQPQQPRQACVGRGCNLPLHVEVKHAFWSSGPLLAETQLSRITCARIVVTEEIDVGVRISGRPVAHEVVEELIPGFDPVALHVARRKRERMVNADDYGLAGPDA